MPKVTGLFDGLTALTGIDHAAVVAPPKVTGLFDGLTALTGIDHAASRTRISRQLVTSLQGYPSVPQTVASVVWQSPLRVKLVEEDLELAALMSELDQVAPSWTLISPEVTRRVFVETVRASVFLEVMVWILQYPQLIPFIGALGFGAWQVASMAARLAERVWDHTHRDQ